MNQCYLSDYQNNRSQNLNFIKFIAALAVIVSHSYPLSQGANCKDFLLKISNQTLGLGGVAVAVFFISSGFFVTKSIEKSKGNHYLVNRFKRIFPPLWFVLILTILICSLFFTSCRLKEFFLSKDFLVYCLNFLLIPIHNLPGVFTNNIFPGVINGALWTLPIEFVCYIVLYVLYKLNLVNKKFYKISLIPVLLLFVVIYYVNLPIILLVRGYFAPLFMFYLGSFFWVFRDKIIMDFKIFILCSVLFVISIFMKQGQLGLLLFFPYIVLYSSFSFKQINANMANLGNYSYGIYLCGWPIQQMVVSLFDGSMSILVNVLICLPIAIIMGYLTYSLIEKRI